MDISGKRNYEVEVKEKDAVIALLTGCLLDLRDHVSDLDLKTINDVLHTVGMGAALEDIKRSVAKEVMSSIVMLWDDDRIQICKRYKIPIVCNNFDHHQGVTKCDCNDHMRCASLEAL